MAQADVLREFLVSLGFKVDQSGMKKFQGSVEGVTKTVTTLGTAVAAAATAVSAAVVKIASNLDNVYFASQRIKSSVENLNAFQYAAKQMGVSAESAMGAMNNLASFMRKYPRSGDWFKRHLGIDTKDENGKDRDRVKVMMDVAKKLREMPEYKAINTGAFLGLDEKTVLALRDPKIDKFFNDYKSMAKDAKLDKAAEDAHKFMTALRGLIEEFKLLGTQVQTALMGKAGEALSKFKTWFDENKPRIVNALTEVSNILLTLATEVLPMLVSGLEIFVKLDDATDGWSTKVIALAAAFRMLGGVAAFKFLMGGGAMAKAIGSRIFGIGAGLGAGVAAATMLSGDTNGKTSNPAFQNLPEVGENFNEVMQFFMDRGWSKENAAGIAANLWHESGFKTNKYGDNGQAIGVAQWHPDRQAEFKRITGIDLKDASRAQQLQFVHHEMTYGNERAAGRALKAQKTAKDSGAVVSTGYERPKNTDKEAFDRAQTAADFYRKATVNSNSMNAAGVTYNQGRDVTINQTTNIQVEGGGDARETARNVVGAQAALNGNLVRNLQARMA